MSAAAPAPGSPGPKRKSRLHHTSLGALAGSAASALRLVVQLTLLPVLARLIGPSEYGLVALAMPVILLANVVADGGLVVALGRLREASRTVESTAFWITVGMGLTLSLTACAAAFPIGYLLGQPRLPWLIIALSPILLMNSATAVSNGRIIRERRFGAFALGDIIATLAGGAMALFGATHGWGAWSLIAQQLALWVCKLTWVSVRGGVSIGLIFRFSEVRDLVTFGANNIGSTIADFVSRNIDNMLVGGVLGATALGYYAMAYQVIRVPDMLISGPFYFYLFTAVSRATHAGDHEAIEDLVRGGLRLTAAALAPLFCGLALLADLAVHLILGPKWVGAIAALRFLAGAGFCFCVGSTIGGMISGVGRAGLQLRLNVIMAVMTIVAVAASVRFGLEAVAAALALGLVLVALYSLDQLARDLRTSRAGLLRAFYPAGLASAGLTGAVISARLLLREAPPIVEFLAAIAAGGAAYLAVIWTVARRRLIADARAFARAQSDRQTSEAGEASQAQAAESAVVESGPALTPVG